jgi:hypothetical protein
MSKAKRMRCTAVLHVMFPRREHEENIGGSQSHVRAAGALLSEHAVAAHHLFAFLLRVSAK